MMMDAEDDYGDIEGTPEDLEKLIEAGETQKKSSEEKHFLYKNVPSMPLLLFDKKDNSYKIVLDQLALIYEDKTFPKLKLRYKNTGDIDGFEDAISYLPSNIPVMEKLTLCKNCLSGLKYIKKHLFIDTEVILKKSNLELMRSLFPYIFSFNSYPPNIVLSKIIEDMIKALEKEKIVNSTQTNNLSDNTIFENDAERDFIYNLGRDGYLYPGTRRVVKSLPAIAFHLKFEKKMEITAKFLMENFRKKDGEKFTIRTCEVALTKAPDYKLL